MKKGEIYFVCEQCGADVQENLIDKDKSNENWLVNKEKCPFCNARISIKVKNENIKNLISQIRSKDLSDILEWVEKHQYISDDLGGGMAIDAYDLKDFLTNNKEKR